MVSFSRFALVFSAVVLTVVQEAHATDDHAAAQGTDHASAGAHGASSTDHTAATHAATTDHGAGTAEHGTTDEHGNAADHATTAEHDDAGVHGTTTDHGAAGEHGTPAEPGGEGGHGTTPDHGTAGEHDTPAEHADAGGHGTTTDHGSAGEHMTDGHGTTEHGTAAGVDAKTHGGESHGGTTYGGAMSAVVSDGHAAHSHSAAYNYDPTSRVDPFDTLSAEVSKWLKDPHSSGITRKDDDWQGSFCNCMENGYITSWYQYAPSLYILDTCSKEDGLILRTGHMQDRYVEPLVASFSCDMLKLMTYCFSFTCPECLQHWDGHCDAAHYSVNACDVDCSGANGKTVSALTFLAVSVAALVAAFQ